MFRHYLNLARIENKVPDNIVIHAKTNMPREVFGNLQDKDAPTFIRSDNHEL